MKKNLTYLSWLTLTTLLITGSQSFGNAIFSVGTGSVCSETQACSILMLPATITDVATTPFTILWVTSKQIKESIVMAEEPALAYVMSDTIPEDQSPPAVVANAITAMEELLPDPHQRETYRALSNKQKAYFVAYAAQELKNK